MRKGVTGMDMQNINENLISRFNENKVDLESLKDLKIRNEDIVGKNYVDDESIFNTIDWNSEAANNFKREFKASKKKVSTALSSIQKLFVTLIKQASDDIQAAEKSNTVKV